MNDIYLLKRIGMDNNDMFFSSLETLEKGISIMLKVERVNVQIGVCPHDERIVDEHGYNVHVKGKPYGFIMRYCVDLFQGSI